MTQQAVSQLRLWSAPRPLGFRWDPKWIRTDPRGIQQDAVLSERALTRNPCGIWVGIWAGSVILYSSALSDRDTEMRPASPTDWSCFHIQCLRSHHNLKNNFEIFRSTSFHQKSALRRVRKDSSSLLSCLHEILFQEHPSVFS